MSYEPHPYQIKTTRMNEIAQQAGQLDGEKCGWPDGRVLVGPLVTLVFIPSMGDCYKWKPHISLERFSLQFVKFNKFRKERTGQ